MWSAPGRYIVLMLLIAGIALPLRSAETPPSKSSTPGKSNSEKKSEKKLDKKILPGPMPPADSKKPIDLKDLDLSTLPAEAILILCERGADALQMVPNAVILTPNKYQEMRDEIERLRKLLQIDKPVAPSRCNLKGRVEESAVLLEAEFQGSTERPNTLVALACPQAAGASAQIDGQVPHIRRGEAGFVVQIEKPGPYHLKLDLFVPLTSRESSGRGFELTLPQAAITGLDLELPANSKDVRIGGRPLNDPELAGLTLKTPHHLSGNPSSSRAVDRLDVAWKELRPPSGVPVRIAEGLIQVRLDPSGLTTEAEMTLRIEGAPANVWQLLVPPNAEVSVTDARVQSTIETEKKPFAWRRTIRLKEASADPLKVFIKTHSPLPRGGSVVPVGPYFVLDAARQTGSIVVRNQVRNLYLYFPDRPAVKPHPRTEEQGGDAAVEIAAFTYSNIPRVEKPQGATGPNSLSWLDLEVETVRGQVRTRVTHNLTLHPTPATAPEARAKSGEKALHWDILTTIAPATKWSDIDQLKVVVPPEWTPADDSIAVTTEKNASVVIYRSHILRERPMQPLPGRYKLPCPPEGRAVLKLPRPQGFIEECEVKIEAPTDCEVLLHNAEQAGLELVRQPRPNEQVWHCHNLTPDWPGLEISWRPYRPEVPATTVVDVTLNGNRADIRHEIRLQLPQTPPSSLSLRVPAAIGESLNILESDKLQRVPEPAVETLGIVRLNVLAGGAERRLVLEYSVPLRTDRGMPPGPQERFTIPLVVPERTQGGIKVRLWSGSNSLPQSAGGSTWEEGSIEEVKGRPDLPVLVLRATRSDAPLLLRSRAEEAVYTVLVERALVRVQLREDGRQFYRASFQIRQLADKYLELKLPVPAGAPSVRITLNHHNVTPEIVNELGQRTEGGDVARLRLDPELVRKIALLEVSYQLRPAGNSSSLRTIFQPPQLRGTPPGLPIRWLVQLPSNRVLIAPESAAGLDRSWARRGWLLAPRVNRTRADLEREFEESLPESAPRESESNEDAATPPALVCWQDSGEPLMVAHAPQQAWLLGCSLSILTLGLALYGMSRPRPVEGARPASWLWPVLVLGMLAAAAGMLFWPTIFGSVVYGCEPGLLVLMAAIVLQWLMHRRYRRQIVFLPSFSRGRAGSSLLRKSSSHRPPSGEPSTVDAPPPAAG